MTLDSRNGKQPENTITELEPHQRSRQEKENESLEDLTACHITHE